MSTTGSFGVTGASGQDEDIFEFTPTLLGPTTTGTWSMYFDGSDVALNGDGEDIDGLAIGPSGDLYLSTTGSFNVPGVSGADEDVFVFTPTRLGQTTAGTFATPVFFDGSVFGLGSNDITAIDLPD